MTLVKAKGDIWMTTLVPETVLMHLLVACINLHSKMNVFRQYCPALQLFNQDILGIPVEIHTPLV